MTKDAVSTSMFAILEFMCYIVFKYTHMYI